MTVCAVLTGDGSGQAGERALELQSELHDKYSYSPIVTSPMSLALDEGQTAEVSVHLNFAPAEDVVLSLEDSAEPDQLVISPSTILFSANDWNSPVPVQVAAMDDTWFEGSHVTGVNISAQSNDPQFQGMAKRVAVTIIDDECSSVDSPAEDLNFDCVVDIADVALFVKSWLWCGPMKDFLCDDVRFSVSGNF